VRKPCTEKGKVRKPCIEEGEVRKPCTGKVGKPCTDETEVGKPKAGSEETQYGLSVESVLSCIPLTDCFSR